jgi:ATP-dependent helicase HrpB
LIRAVQRRPIDPLIPEILAAVTRHRRVILRAPPGAGKTTRIPPALLEARIAGDRQIVVLEPRRIAARAAAEFIAQERDADRVGGTVGYRVRFEQRGGETTRLWFVTEGVFSRQLTTDPFLDQVGIVVLDEFHERHLQGDVALAIIRELQDSVRPDLRLIVMSATLDTERLAAALGDAAVLTSEGKSHPVRVDHDDAPATERRLGTRVAAALGRVLSDDPRDRGDILVFLPGAREIRHAATAIEDLATGHDLEIVTLHGTQPLDAQRRALQASVRRRVILSTNVAETALTVEGVTTVIDTGLARTARFDARHGINSLRTVPISRASADQRTGRAGRLQAGRCVRLWTGGDHEHRRPHETPEILRLDLSRMLLELRGWGMQDARALAWLDPPPEAALAGAEALLLQLGAIETDSGHLTARGRRMLELPVPPRLAAVLVEAERLGCVRAGALMTALVSERDICRQQRLAGPHRAPDQGRWATGSSDLVLRMDLFQHATQRRLDRAACEDLDLDIAAVRTVDRAHRQLLRILQPARSARHVRHANEQPRRTVANASPTDGTPPHAAVERDTLRRCLLAGFPDRVARRRAPGSPRALMVGNRGLLLSEQSVVRDAEFFLAIDVERVSDRGATEARVRLASAVERTWLTMQFPDAVTQTTSLVFDAEQERVMERTRECFHDLVLDERSRADVDRARAGEILAVAARRDPWSAAGLGEAERAFLARIVFLRDAVPELDLPADPDALLIDTVAALCAERRSFDELRGADAVRALRRSLTSAQITALDRDAPATLALPGGRTAPLAYARGKAPIVAARIQELFGLAASPRLGRGRVPVVIELLAPNRRPVQITNDLESFWHTTYADVRKQLRGRYPKHAWPEDPMTASPSSRPGKRRS